MIPRLRVACRCLKSRLPKGLGAETGHRPVVAEVIRIRRCIEAEFGHSLAGGECTDGGGCSEEALSI
jgi:hypothetical protein